MLSVLGMGHFVLMRYSQEGGYLIADSDPVSVTQSKALSHSLLPEQLESPRPTKRLRVIRNANLSAAITYILSLSLIFYFLLNLLF